MYLSPHIEDISLNKICTFKKKHISIVTTYLGIILDSHVTYDHVQSLYTKLKKKSMFTPKIDHI